MLSEHRLWGAVPPGFKKITDKAGARLVVREDRISDIDPSICRADRPAGDRRYHGRSALTALRLPDGGSALIRDYRHGGLFRGVTRGWFFTWPPRPFRELAITEELRRRGLRTVEIYAAGVQTVGGPFYRGCLVMRELGDAQDLWATLQDPSMGPGRLAAVLKAAADIVRRMHREGVYHGDLNLKNLLIRNSRDSVEGYVIDFDKAKLFLGRLPPLMVNRNLERLHRSAFKLDPERRYLTAASWKEFVNFYHGAQDV
jgi:serine/threonine protein kinase